MKYPFHIKAIPYLIAGILVLAAIFTYMKFDGVLYGQPVEFATTTVQTTLDSYVPLQTVQARIVVCKARDIPGHLQWTLSDSYIKFFQPKDIHAAPGCYDHIVDLEMLPPDTYPDTYTFDGYFTYRINMFSTVHYHIKTNEFKVTRKPI